MVERMPIAIVGCGGMGRRHLTGVAALYRSDFRNVDLAAVCDINRQNAEDLADEAAQQLGSRPQVFGSIADLAAAMPDVRGVDIVTDAASHHRLAVSAFEAGLNVLCEKPLALTMRGCNAIIDAATAAGRVLSVAENYRRDPMDRLIRALIDDGAIGTPRLALDLNVGGGDRMIITPWRHKKLSGTIVLDAGVHNADILQYYLGGVESVYGEGRLFEKYRRKGVSGGPGGFYAKWADTVPDRFEADGEDAIFGYLRFANGTIGQWTYNRAGFGQPFNTLQVFGSKGSITSQGHRNGKTPRLFVGDAREIVGESILEQAPSFRLSPAAAALFGGDRPYTYSFPFAETDAKLLALEYHEFAECIRTGARPEVDGAVARHAVAIVNGLLESGMAGRALTLSEVESEGVDSYQREIDAHYGLA